MGICALFDLERPEQQTLTAKGDSVDADVVAGVFK